MSPITHLVILDTNGFKQLTDDAVRDRVKRRLARDGLTLWPTLINALELAQNPHPPARVARLKAAAEFLGDRALLPDPDLALLEMGRAVAAGGTSFQCGASGFEWLLSDPESIADTDIATIRSTLSAFDERLQTAFQTARAGIRAFLAKHNRRREWTSAREFLDTQWYTRSQLDDLIRYEWTRLGLDGDAPIDALFANPTWRLHFEGFGAALFGKVIARDQSRTVHGHDIAQLVYLAGRDQGTLVTDDGPFYDTACAVIDGRHAGLSVARSRDFFEDQR